MGNLLDRVFERHPDESIPLRDVVRNCACSRRNRLTGLCRDLDAGTRRIEFPAVVRADDAAVFDQAERECGATVDAEIFEDTDTGIGTKGNELLVEQHELLRLLGDIFDASNRMPELGEALGRCCHWSRLA